MWLVSIDRPTPWLGASLTFTTRSHLESITVSKSEEHRLRGIALVSVNSIRAIAAQRLFSSRRGGKGFLIIEEGFEIR